MPGTSTPFKLGLFSIAALVGLVAAAIGLGIRSTRVETQRFQTYFDESAQGLELGSPVKYRGVRIGNVSDISIAPDRKQVSVGLAIERAAAERLSLADGSPALRTQLAIQGITGVKFIDMDFVGPSTPLPILGFPPGPRYIPSRPSLIKGIEGRLGGVVRELPDMIDSATATFDKMSRALDEMREQQLAQRAARVLDKLDGTAREIDEWVGGLKRAHLPDRAAATLNRVDALTYKLDRTADQLEGTQGLIASATRTSDAFGEVGRSARTAGRELDRTLRELGEAARAIRELVDELEREPDMLVKGKARSR